jgi:lysophospholipase L1-like esterase
MKLHRLLAQFLLPVFCCLAAAQARALTVFLVGDSTVANFDLPDPRQGWGQVIGPYFAADVTVKNYALSGRSSKSFLAEGAWAPVLEQIKPGDYVLIQFGHNDEKRDAERGTDPYSSYQECLSQYVDDTAKAGGSPILITSVARGSFRRNFSHGNYPDAMIALAKKKGIPYIDLNARSEALYHKLGGSATYSLFIASIDGKDNTHFTPAGAQALAKLVAQGIQELGIPLSEKVQLGQ